VHEDVEGLQRALAKVDERAHHRWHRGGLSTRGSKVNGPSASSTARRGPVSEGAENRRAGRVADGMDELKKDVGVGGNGGEERHSDAVMVRGYTKERYLLIMDIRAIIGAVVVDGACVQLQAG
jgi:hypothetical protein